ncbi:MAG: amidohydrolase family protein [Burkholderiaceae bacterium]
MSLDSEVQLRLRAPALACDAHFHVFGPAEQYAYEANLRYKPPLAPLSDYLELAKLMGFERFVFVQPSAYGRDNRCMLDAMAQVGTERCRGIVDVHEDVSDAELELLHGLGVRGIRINVSPVQAFAADLGQSMLPRILKLDGRCAELGWHLDFLLPGWLTQEMLPTFAKLKVNYSLAHMGMFLAQQGPEQVGFKALLDLLRHGNGHCWVKFTGTYRMATAPHYQDAAAMAQALIAAAPDRLIWGSDYPHLSFADQVGSAQLFNLLADWTPDPAVRHKILVDNPKNLFGF